MVPLVGHRLAGYRARRLGAERMVDLTLAHSLAHPGRLDPALREQLIARATERAGFPETSRAYAEASRSLFAYLQGGMPADLARLRCPTLMVHGATDLLVPVTSARAAAARHPHLALEVLDDCGHAPQLDAPDRFLAVVVPWLGEVAAEGTARA